MDLGLKGRTAVITGGSKGIGYAVAEELAREGVHLHLSARGEAELAEAKRLLTVKFDVEVQTHALDLSDREARDRFAHDRSSADIWVNCAGAIPGGGFDQVDEDTWRKAWDLKLFGYIGMTRIVYPEMCRRQRGVIINVVGTGGLATRSTYICGGPNNAALINFTHSLGGESVRYGVRVCGVNPGPVETDRMTYLRELEEKKVAPEKLKAWRGEYYSKMAYGRAATPEEVSGAVAFLASERASYISGAMITIDGGLLARGGASAVLETESA